MRVISVYLNKERTRAIKVALCQNPTAEGFERTMHHIPVTDGGTLIFLKNGRVPIIKGPLNPDFFNIIKVTTSDEYGIPCERYLLRFKYKPIQNQAKLDNLMANPDMVLETLI